MMAILQILGFHFYKGLIFGIVNVSFYNLPKHFHTLYSYILSIVDLPRGSRSSLLVKVLPLDVSGDQCYDLYHVVTPTAVSQ